MQKWSLLILRLSLSAGVSSSALSFAAPATELALLHRCYTHLTGRPVPLNSPYRAEVIAGTKTARQICESLIDDVELDSTTGLLLNANPTSQLILNNLYDFHRSWFDIQTFEQMQNFDVNQSLGVHDIYDASEGALALTHNLFRQKQGGQDERYENVLRTNHGFIALRAQDAALKTRLFPFVGAIDSPFRRIDPSTSRFAVGNILFKTAATWSNTGNNWSSSQVIEIPMIKVGELTGIKAQDQSVIIPNYAPRIRTDFTARSEHAVGSGLKVNFNFFESAGGGVLGFNSYMLLNWGHEPGVRTNGSLKTPRRWIESTLKTFLCKELPILRDTDITALVDSSGGPDVAPFRQGANCVQCHASMDQMAIVGRNYLVSATDYWYRNLDVNPTPPANGNAYARNSYILGRYEPTLPASAGWSSTPVTDFHMQAPHGRIFMRSFDGTLVNQPVTSISSLGQNLSSQRDYYHCAAKRYFEHLTGIEVPLYDRGDRRFKNLTSSLDTIALQRRQFIEKLGDRLRSHQSLKTLLKEIMSSSFYRDQNYEPTLSEIGGP